VYSAHSELTGRRCFLGIFDNIRASITGGGSKSMFHTIVLLR
jgi:hypothetical protein